MASPVTRSGTGHDPGPRRPRIPAVDQDRVQLGQEPMQLEVLRVQPGRRLPLLDGPLPVAQLPVQARELQAQHRGLRVMRNGALQMVDGNWTDTMTRGT